jgi:hypothetical protein
MIIYHQSSSQNFRLSKSGVQQIGIYSKKSTSVYYCVMENGDLFGNHKDLRLRINA